jgi:hypothetical protein
MKSMIVSVIETGYPKFFHLHDQKKKEKYKYK